MIALVAALLAFFAIFRIDLAGSPVVSFRYHQRWQSQEALLLGTRSFRISPVISPSRNPAYRAYSLGIYYATLATSSEVERLVLRDGPLQGSYRAFVDINASRGSTNGICENPPSLVSCHSDGQSPSVPVPVLKIEGTAGTGATASGIASRVSRGFRAYILQQQEAANIPTAQRVKLTVVSPAATNVKQVQGHRLLWPLIPLSVVFVLLALALVSARRSKT